MTKDEWFRIFIRARDDVMEWGESDATHSDAAMVANIFHFLARAVNAEIVAQEK